ncbi:MAG: fatty acid desaturase [Rhodanobacteraceae bacterium]
MFESLLNLASNGILQTGLVAKLVSALVMTQLTILAVTLYLHRSQSHRSVAFHPALAHAFRFWCWLTTAMVTKEWVAIHRKHHAHCETELDPHSPQIFGIGKLIRSGTELYMSARADANLLARFGRGTPEDWIERHLYTPHCNWGPTALAVLEIALFGVGGMAIWAVQMMWIPFWGAGVVNGMGHWWGYRNFETADRSTNLSPLAIWVGGEELHNNHHAFPSSAKFSVRRFEFDLGWLVIRILAKLRLAKVKRIASGQHSLRPKDPMPAESPLPATLTERVRVMTRFFRDVMLPAMCDESHRGGNGAPPMRLRRALANGGCWLNEDDRGRLNAWIDARPCLRTLCHFRAQLAQLMEQRDIDAETRGLSQWLRAARDSDIGSLRTFAAALAADAFAKPRTLPVAGGIADAQ